MNDLTFETMNDALEHATFVSRTIECVVAGEKCVVDPPKDKQGTGDELIAEPTADDALKTFVDSATSVVHNFTGSPLERWQMEQLCKSKRCITADDVLGKVIEIKHVYFHPCEILDAEGGEISTMIRTVIITPEKLPIGFVSAGVATAMMSLYKLFEGKPFEPAVRLKVEQKQTRLGRRVYVIEPVMDDDSGS